MYVGAMAASQASQPASKPKRLCWKGVLKCLLTKQSWNIADRAGRHFPRSSGHHKDIDREYCEDVYPMFLFDFTHLLSIIHIKLGNLSLSVLSPPFLRYVWTSSASVRQGAERYLWSAFYWYVYLFEWFYSHLNTWTTLGYSISMIVYGFTLFRCV